MINDLTALLGPERRGQVREHLAWLVAYAVLQGVTMALLVPVLRALLDEDEGRTPLWIGVLAAAVVVTCVARYVQAMKGFRLSLLVLASMHERLGDRVAELPLGWFSSERVGRLSRSATGGTTSVTNIAAFMLESVVTGVVTPATIAVALLVIDWRLGVAALVTAPLIIWVHRRCATWISRGEERAEDAKTEAANRVVEFARQQPTLRAFGRATGGYPPLEEAIERQNIAGSRWLAETMPRLLVNGLAAQLAFVVLIGVGVFLGLADSIDPVTLVALLALSARFVGPLAEAAAHSGNLRMAGNDLRRIADIMRERPLPQPTEPKKPEPTGEVEVDHVDFGYVPDQLVLRDVSFHAARGTTTAIVGPSGSGKTTVTRLLTRFYDTTAGTVRVGGVDVREQTTADLMAQFAPVTQETYLFDDTLEGNVRLGRPEASAEELREAASIAGVDEIVERLPDGWRTRVGEGGRSLSGGERQRVALARALLKDAPIVLLDEATAALDPQNERHVTRALRTLRERSTLIVIAHNLPTVAHADQILVLDEGRIIARGRHAELLDGCALYRRFWNERKSAADWRLVDSGRRR
ncbi:ABC transporter ATP-binding protein [Streptomyces sp. NPDC005438]|uniref:ABC transporter ATP-binding protein n=1 Tax=Streptomyces sp. NPDC005438 TaxID=3156880 RepID=UPI0033B99BCD